MSNFAAFLRKRQLEILESNPRVFAHLLAHVPDASPIWDARPDPDRFTLREVLAHLIDLDTVMRERVERMITEINPLLENWDETKAARHYAGRIPSSELQKLAQSRGTMIPWLRGLSDKEWASTGTRDAFGSYSVYDVAGMLTMHDNYHLIQIVDWLKATG